MHEDHGVAGAEIILDCPFHGGCALVAEIDGDPDLPLGTIRRRADREHRR
uniref:Uncharacterized protein MANES_S039200 n=1 Tax=Rhizophora mucronata TaxID=61149 RepID=A0A2P2NR87_RHIMU